MTFVLCILDGWGVRLQQNHNGILSAKTPNYDRFLKQYPNTTLQASEHYVGLPHEQMGNSEVGHMNIGAGRIVQQLLPRIDEAISKNQIQTFPAYEKLKATKGIIHLIGLISDGGVHSHIDQIISLAKILERDGKTVYLHAFLDGRDTPPQSAINYLQKVIDAGLKVVSVGGRYYGMDRDKRWDRIEKAYDAIVLAKCGTYTDPISYVQAQYEKGVTDEFIVPAVSEGYQGLHEEDAVFVANFRADRVRQILKTLTDKSFEEFYVKSFPHLSLFGLTEYSEELNLSLTTFFPSFQIHNTLGEVVSKAGFAQLRLGETEKYAHVTFFLNGGNEERFVGEDRILVPSPKVKTYDLKPEMSAIELCDSLCENILSQRYGLIVVNFANADMVGHTGIESAIGRAIETLDVCLGRIEEALLAVEGMMVVTADHGNAEETFDESSNQPHTAHTLNPVPLILVNGPKIALKSGRLCDIAPTILKLMNLPIPEEMTGDVLCL